MRVTFAGIGEAFDETLANTSLLVESKESTVLLDCGFTAASAFWSVARTPLELDAVYLTHFHGDHYFGLPALLVRSVEEGRTKALAILGPTGVEERVRALMEMAYTSVMERARFDITFTECGPSDDFELAGLRFRFAENDHSVPCLSVRLDADGKSVFYSGDGRPTDQTRTLATECSLAVHESFSLEPDTPGHGTVASAIDFGRDAGVGQLALVHVQRTIRRERKQEILSLCDQTAGLRVLLPEPGDTLKL